MLDYFDISDTSDIPEYTNNSFKGGRNLRYALLYLMEIAKKPVTAKHLRVAFYRKYHDCKNFQDLSVTQVSLLLRNLITQKDILTIERGLYTVNKDKKRREIVPKQNKNTSIENGPLVSKILSILAEKPLIDKIELCNIINERTPNLQLSESGLVNILSHLKKSKKITCTKGLYKINNEQEKTQRKKRTIKNNTKSGNSEC